MNENENENKNYIDLYAEIQFSFALTYDLEIIRRAIYNRRGFQSSETAIDYDIHLMLVFLVYQFRICRIFDHLILVTDGHG